MRLPMLAAPGLFYQFDLFHVAHQGIIAEFVGSAIDSRFYISFMFLTLFYCNVS